MNKFLIPAAALGAALSAGAASAGGLAEPVVVAPVVAPAPLAFDWTGGYAGAQIGGIYSNNDARFGGDSVSPDPEGMVGGLYGGYNWQFGTPWVWGVEGEYNWSDADGSDRDGGARFTTELNDTAAIRGRVGYAMDRTLFYATGGWAWADYDSKVELDGARAKDSGTLDGWTAGVGVEHAFTDSLVGRLDYRYSDYGNFTYGRFDGSKVRGSLDTNEIRAGLAIKF